MSTMRRLLVPLLALASCASTVFKIVPIERPARRYSPVAKVEILTTPPDRPHRAVSELQIWREDGKTRLALIDQLQVEGASRGCNALLFYDTKVKWDDGFLWLPPTQEEPGWSGFAAGGAGYRARCVVYAEPGGLPTIDDGQ